MRPSQVSSDMPGSTLPEVRLLRQPTPPRRKLLMLAGHQHSLLTFRKNLLIAFARTLEVKAAAPEADPVWTRQLADIGIDYRSLPFIRDRVNGLADLRLIYWYRRWIAQEKPTYVFAYTIKPVIYGSLAALGTDARVFVLISGLGYSFGDAQGNRRLALSWAVSTLYRAALRKVEHVFFQNPDDAELFLQRKILRPTASFSVVNGSGVDLDEYPYTPAPPAPVRFLLMARLIRSKGIGEYIQAAAALKQKFPDAEFCLLGEKQLGSPDALDEAMLERACASGVIRYLGQTDNVVPFLQQSSVYVLPSYYREGVPRSILEAMSVGRPVVTTELPGCKETVVSGENGYLVADRDPHALALAMERFLRDPSLIVSMGRASRVLAEEKYDDRQVNKTILTAMGLTSVGASGADAHTVKMRPKDAGRYQRYA